MHHLRSTDGRGPAPSAPLGFVPSGWKRQVKAADGGVYSLGYRLCLLDAMRIGIWRRDLFASPSLRFADPRIGLLTGSAWEAARPSICRTLGLSTDGPAEVARLAERLDAAYQDTAANLPKNAAVQVDGSELVLSALDKLEESPSLVALKAAVAARMPLVDLPELLLEMHARTGFADGLPMPVRAAHGPAASQQAYAPCCWPKRATPGSSRYQARQSSLAPIAAELGEAELHPGRDAHPDDRHLGRSPEPHPARPRLGRR